MDETPDYARYSWEQLQDALAHINRERYPLIFAALQDEIERRLHQPSLPEAVPILPTSSPPLPEVVPSAYGTVTPFHSSSSRDRGCLSAFWGWLAGGALGLVAGAMQYSLTIAHLKAVGNMAYDRDDAGFALIGCCFIDSLIGGIFGLCVGLWLGGRYSKSR